jgi:hypothetical protein
MSFKNNNKNNNNNELKYEIDVKYVGEDEYFGFTLDGNCRYLMGDFTVTHNTCSAIGVAEEMRDFSWNVRNDQPRKLPEAFPSSLCF